MSTRQIVTLCGFCLLIFACKQKRNAETPLLGDGVTFDTSFNGARLSKVYRLEENQYIGEIFPEFEPVNNSPWFAFGVTANDKKSIQITLDYGAYPHRYIPKISTNKIHWKALDTSKVKMDTLNGDATLILDVSPQKIYVAAQEIETSAETYSWMNNYANGNYGINIKEAGKTALNKPNYVLEHETEAEDCVVLIARQHPPEVPGGTIAFKKFYETMVSDSDISKEFRKHFNIYTFPLLNPDGADMGNWRHNAKGVDLNRDWVDFTQPETKMVKRFVENKLKQGKKVRFALDFHTSYSGPYVLVLDSINEIKTSGIIPNWIAQIESNSSFKVETRRRSQALPYCYNYFFNNCGAEAVTYEDGDEIDRDTIRKRAAVYAENLMQTLLEKQKDGVFKK
ncbi:M14 family metallopeptidase [Flagellimonas sp. S3867]|uniref:M14 family metallopeptidase n=1 Tax=Flagellimonas sp. S3867 TaxID=2768063 RepID=UPI001686550F|nr:M14 family zinc carboxypeptidase [Flagellimonas sp. S3867]